MEVVLPEKNVMNVESVIFKETSNFQKDPEVSEFYIDAERYKMTKEAADTYSARPGHSEHQTGLAIDICNKDKKIPCITSAFNNTDTNNYESSYGSTFASTSGTSDKYATKYAKTIKKKG